MPIAYCELRDGITAEWRPGYRLYRVPVKATATNADGSPNEIIGPATILSQYPKTLLVSTYQYGFDAFDQNAILISLSAPRRAGNNKSKHIWIMEAIYEFDQSQRPEFQFAEVEPYFVGEQEPIRQAKYGGLYHIVGNVLTPKGVNPELETFTVGQTYPISNSAEVPILPTPEREASRAAYRVSWHMRSKFDFQPFINTVNLTDFTLIGVAYNVVTGAVANQTEIFRKSFTPGTLRLRDVQSPIVQFYNNDWYKVTLDFVEDNKYLYELDRGYTAKAAAGLPDGRGGTFSEGDFPEGSSGQRELTDLDGNSVSDPVFLDGTGQPLQGTEKQQPVFLRWEKYQDAEFNSLPIGVE